MILVLLKVIVFPIAVAGIFNSNVNNDFDGFYLFVHKDVVEKQNGYVFINIKMCTTSILSMIILIKLLVELFE